MLNSLAPLPPTMPPYILYASMNSFGSSAGLTVPFAAMRASPAWRQRMQGGQRWKGRMRSQALELIVYLR
jgi:hypothetical protein